MLACLLGRSGIGAWLLLLTDKRDWPGWGGSCSIQSLSLLSRSLHQSAKQSSGKAGWWASRRRGRVHCLASDRQPGPPHLPQCQGPCPTPAHPSLSFMAAASCCAGCSAWQGLLGHLSSGGKGELGSSEGAQKSPPMRWPAPTPTGERWGK